MIAKPPACVVAVLLLVTAGCATRYETTGYTADRVTAEMRLSDSAPASASLAGSAPADAADAAASDADLPDSPTEPVVAQIQRQVIYTGALTVLSPDPDGAVEAVRRVTREAGGYVDSIRGQRIAVRVPADRFESVMSDIAALGLVTDRQVDAADVTAELVDLDIRLDNLESLRGRMKGLLEKADKVEDALLIEKELARLTGEIESIKGRLRLLRDQVSLSTINVAFNTPSGTASGIASRIRPFPWVLAVGAEAFGVDDLPRAQSKLGRGTKLDLPAGFVRFYQQDYRVYAIDRGQVILKVSRYDNFDDAPAGFWADQVRDRLTQDLGVPMSDPQRVVIDDDETGYTMTGNHAAGQERLGYFVGLAANDDHVFLVEAWGPAEQVDAKNPEMLQSLRTLRINRGWW